MCRTGRPVRALRSRAFRSRRPPRRLIDDPLRSASNRVTMITVYGADWCEDTRRSLRLLRRLHVANHYINIDEDLDALDRAKALNHGERRTPTIDLGLCGGAPP